MMREMIAFLLCAAVLAVPTQNVMQPEPKDSLTCIACEDVVAVIEGQLQKNATEESIKNAIQDICNVIEKYVPGAATVCKAAEDNVDTIIHLLESQLDPQEVCKMISFCDNSKSAVVAPIADTCETCQQIVQLIETQVQQNATEQRIQQLVGVACGVIEKYLPQAQAECEFVQNNIQTIIGLIVSEVQPAQICSLIGQCSRSTTRAASKVTSPANKNVLINACDTCEELVGLVESELQQNATVAEVKQLVTEACDFIEKYIPEIAPECSMVEDNIDQLIDYVVNNVTPVEACTLLGVCQGKSIPAIAKALKAKHML